jgi:hypothetical protein
MEAMIDIGAGASLTYTEGHFHGPYGGMLVLPHATAKIGKGARYFSDFSLLFGSVGSLDYLVGGEEDGIAELTAKIVAHRADRISSKKLSCMRGTIARADQDPCGARRGSPCGNHREH